MLETIRQFAEDQLVASGATEQVRCAHARYFAGRETDVMALWDGPHQREAYEWFAVELGYGGLLGYLVENYEPIAWAKSS